MFLEIRDDSSSKEECTIGGITIYGPIGNPEEWADNVHVTLGDNFLRKRYSGLAIQHGKKLVTVSHPDATISIQAKIGKGVFVGARCVIGPSARVSDGVIVNHAAIIDHDCNIGAWSHIAPGAIIGGGCTIGEECLVGSGAIILPNTMIGNGTIVGSGAVVTKNQPTGVVIKGVPAR